GRCTRVDGKADVVRTSQLDALLLRAGGGGPALLRGVDVGRRGTRPRRLQLGSVRVERLRRAARCRRDLPESAGHALRMCERRRVGPWLIPAADEGTFADGPNPTRPRA